MKNTFIALILTLGIFLITGTPANAEGYLGGHIGYVMPQDLDKVKGVGSAKGITLSDLELINALMYGIKAGYFFPGYMDFLGLEFEVFTANPHIKQQNVTAGFGGSSSPLGTLDGSHLRIITPAMNVILRVPGYYVEPYVGAGLGVFFAHLSDSTGSDDDVAPGLNLLAGSRFYVNETWALFAEGKYNYTKFNFKDSLFEAHYSSISLVGGISFLF